MANYKTNFIFSLNFLQQLKYQDNSIEFIFRIRKQPMITFFIILTCIMQLSFSNLICNGDFENLSLNQQGLDSANKPQKFDYFDPNPLCWYTSTGKQIQVLQINNGKFPTNAADFVSAFSYDLCQKINFEIQAIYQLNYTFAYDPILTSGSILALLDGKQIKRITYQKNLIQTAFVNFTATKSTHQICFHSLQACPLSSLIYCGVQYSPFLDNVTLNLLVHSPAYYNSLVNNNISNSTNSSSLINQNVSNTNASYQNANSTINVTPIQNNISSDNTTSYTNNSLQVQQMLQNGPIIIPIHFKSSPNYLQNSFTLTSDFKLKMYGLTPRSFFGLIVSIRGQPQNNVIFSQNTDGFLEIVFHPQYIIDILRLKDLSVYYPKQIYDLQTFFRFQFYIDGKHVTYVTLSKQQYRSLGTMEQVAQKLASSIYTSFMILNALSLSYLIINLIGFWNLCLMYSFLMIETIPAFALNFMHKIRDNLFLRTTFKFFIYKMRQLNSNSQLMDFQIFQPREKIDRYKQQFQWFNYVGISSNTFNNNLDSFFLVAFFFVRYFIFKITFFLLPIKFAFRHYFETFKLFNRFIDELTCFSPFITISALQTLFDLAQISFLPKINSFIQIKLLFIILVFPVINFSLKDHSIERKAYPKKHNKIQLKKYDMIDSFCWSLLCIFIPLLIEFRIKLIFYIVITFLIIFRIINFIKNAKYLFWKQMIFRMFSTFNWLIFHTTFIFYYSLEFFPDDQIQKIKMVIKYSGFVVIGCIFIGGIVDLIDFIINILIVFYLLIKKIVKFCIRNKKIFNNSQNVSFHTTKKQKNVQMIEQNLSMTGKTLIKIKKDEFYNSKRKIQQRMFFSQNAKTSNLIMETMLTSQNLKSQTNSSFNANSNTFRQNNKNRLKQKINKHLNLNPNNQQNFQKLSLEQN